MSVQGGGASPEAGGAAPRVRLGLIALWLVSLAAIAWLALAQLKLSGDLRLFMPQPRDAAQRLLMNQLGEGPGARLLLLALSGAEPDMLAERSRALRERLLASPEFVWAGNGEEGLEAIPAALADYRYLLSPGVVEGAFAAPALRAALQQRLQDLASPAGALAAPLIGSDPTLETLRVLEAWAPAAEPQRFDGVWFSPDQAQALLVVETAAPGFDPDGQQRALTALRAAHAQVLVDESDASPDASFEAPIARVGADRALVAKLEISGPGAFAERMAAQTRGEATRLGGFGIAGLLLLMALAYRSLSLPLLGALPLATGAVAGLASTAWLFGEVHGITLAFGFTLLGVAQDYPVHLFSHRRIGVPAAATARAIWPTLATGAFSSALAYLVFFFAGVDGLRQLAALTVAGLLAAALATRFLLPAVLGPQRRDLADARLPRALQLRLRHVHRQRWLAPVLGAAAGVALLLPGPWWQDDLAALTPVPPELLQRDRALRQALGAPDVRWLLALRADSREAALERSAALLPALDQLRSDGVLSGFELAARYLPSAALQRQRQQQLPEPQTLRAALAEAQSGLAFRSDAFEGFLAAVERARRLSPLRVEDLAGTALELRLAGLLARDGEQHLALIQLSGLEQPKALLEFTTRYPELDLIDLKTTANGLASAWRGQVLATMAAGAVLLSMLVWLSLRSARRAARVLLPVALASLLVLALLHLMALPLTLFHLISLVLAAGLGLDYALFFERSRGGFESDGGADQRRTLHALLLCAASTLLVFGLLSLSSIPVLQALGTTVALGVVCHFLMALLLAAAPASPSSPSTPA